LAIFSKSPFEVYQLTAPTTAKENGFDDESETDWGFLKTVEQPLHFLCAEVSGTTVVKPFEVDSFGRILTLEESPMLRQIKQASYDCNDL
jgi:hypothetical protein